jgi:hypothetical protein
MVSESLGLPEPGLHLDSVGMAEVVQDGEGVLPGLAAGAVLAVGAVSVAEVGDRVSFVVPIAEFPPQEDRVL